MRRRELQLSIGIVLVMLLTGCPWFGEEGGTDADVGKLRINIAAGSEVRSILPPVTMEVTEYLVTVERLGVSYSQTVSPDTPTTTFANLAVGDWDVTVEGFSGGGAGDPVLIARGTVVVSITAGDVTIISLTIGPIAGQGSLSLEITWPEGIVAAPGVVATLEPSTGGDTLTISSEFDTATTPNVARYAGAIAAGYYELTIALTDGGVTVWGPLAGVSVRIVDGLTTLGQFNLIESEMNPVLVTGSLQITVGSDLQNPYDVSLAATVGDPPAAVLFEEGATPVIEPTDEMTVTATLDPDVAGDTYAWYLNGVLLADAGATATIGGTGATIGAGTAYQLSLLVTHGDVLSSQSVSFRVDSAAP